MDSSHTSVGRPDRRNAKSRANYGGPRVSGEENYVHAGLQGWGSPCGTDGNYAYIFGGSVTAATEITETEKRLQVTPEEMFLGAASQLTVTTNQGACLPEILPGDQWLFYLRRDDTTKALLLEYGDPSEPIADAQPAITRLRRLAAMTDSGIIAGYATRPVWHDDDKYLDYLYPPNHKIVAKRQSNGTEYSAITDSDGNYEFEPPPSGSYDLRANTEKGLWAEEGTATVHPPGCEAFAFELHSDGEISGHVRSPDGNLLRSIPGLTYRRMTEEYLAHSTWTIAGTTKRGGLEPGRYLVGIGIQATTDSPEWRSRVYYPGVRTREKAVVIELGKAAKRANVDFTISPTP